MTAAGRDMDGELEEMTAVIETIGEELLAQRDQVSELADRVDQLTAALADPKRPAVFRWEILTEKDPAEAERRWVAFNDWVNDMYQWFGYPEIPGCPQWFEHKGLIEELTALWIEWLAAWRSRASPTDPPFFHEALDRARPRFAAIAPSCTRREHQGSERPAALPTLRAR
jgi:hypothetical protein